MPDSQRGHPVFGPMSERDTLLRHFSYDPESGEFTHNYGVRSVRPGRKAGGVTNNGYTTLALGRKRYLAHRVAWLFERGKWPANFIDHKNGVKTDNRIENLREATNTQNLWNSAGRNSRSGFKGVYLRHAAHKRRKKYQASIKVHGKTVRLGNFEDPSAAHEAYKAAALKHFGDFAYKGKQ